MAIIDIDFDLPVLTTNYSEVLDKIRYRSWASLTMFNVVETGNTFTYTDIPENSIKLADISTDLVFQEYVSSSWTNITSTFQMTVTKLESPGGTQELGAYYLDLGNATGTLAAATVNDAAHGNRIGGSLHAPAVASTSNGFMTGADKQKLDDLTGQTGAETAALYHSEIPLVISAEYVAGTETGTRRYSPALVTGSISAKMQKTDALIHTGVYNVGTVSSATPIDASDGVYQKMILGGNTTLSFSSTGVYTLYLSISQDGTGSRTLTLPANDWWEGGNRISISSTAGSLSILTVHYNGTNLIYSLSRDVKAA